MTLDEKLMLQKKNILLNEIDESNEKLDDVAGSIENEIMKYKDMINELDESENSIDYELVSVYKSVVSMLEEMFDKLPWQIEPDILEDEIYELDYC